MNSNPEDYCQIFVNASCGVEELTDFTACAVNGERHQWSIVTDVVEIDVEENDESDPKKTWQCEDGFLYFSYYLEIGTRTEGHQEDLIGIVSLILESYWQRGWDAVAACGFEDRLPKSGGFSCFSEKRRQTDPLG